MDIFSILQLFGGLAMFLYGMHVMGGGLEKTAGGRFEKILETLTSSPIKGVCLGVAVTAVIQSSSATTVMVVGFVNSGIMKLSQAIGIIMGANVGTTVTSWLLSMSSIQGDHIILRLLKPESFTPVLAMFGIIMIMTGKNSKKSDIGSILIGFAVLMFGMNQMSSAVKPLADVPEFTNFLLLFQNPLFGVIAGAILTAIIQSSSASVGILQALSATGAIAFGTALPIILGQNIGTCITAIISCIGANKNAKRAAVVHLYFNIIGTVLFLIVYYSLNAFIHFSFADQTVNAVGIAIVHTIFNLSTTLVLLPFARVLERLSFLTIKEKDEEKEHIHLLDERFLTSPSFAVEQCRTVTSDMCDLAMKTLGESLKMLRENYDEKLAEEIVINEKKVDKYEDKIGTYLIKLSSTQLSHKDSTSISVLLHSIGDFERISDHAVNLLDAAQEIYTKKIMFTEDAIAELTVLFDAVDEITKMAENAFTDRDVSAARNVEPLEDVIDTLTTELRVRHINRLQDGRCTIEMGFIFSDILNNAERVSDHCSNIAVAVIQGHEDSLNAHKYLNNIKKNDPNYDRKVEAFRNKYVLADV